MNPETQFVLDYWKVSAPELVEKVEEGQNIILVDHNEMAQAVDGLDKANLLEIIDHHRLGGIVTANPLLVRMQPVGVHGHHPVQCGCGKQSGPAQRNRRPAVLCHQLRHPVLQVSHHHGKG